MSGIDIAPGLHVNSHRFREARGPDWDRLETLLDRVEAGRAGSLSDEDLFELPVLYRATLSSLSVARETSLDADLVAYLESLSTRAYFLLYGVHSPLWRRALAFLADELPAAVRGMWRETLVSLAITVAGAVAAYMLVRSDPSWFFGIVPSNMIGGRDPSASVATLTEALHHKLAADDHLSAFAAELFVNNASVALFAFALGFAFAVPTVLLLIYNGCMLGAMLAVFIPKGLGWEFAAWLSIHGTTEMFAIILAGAAGMRIGIATAFPGRQARLASAVSAGRSAAFVMLGVVGMLVIAGLLEGLGRQLVDNSLSRALIGGAALLFWLVYYYLKPANSRKARKLE
ncbi:stage II sporulation protein M [Sphingomonas sp. LB-2]|uniref:stage II sporulation protein M n=1 Tax=Sphingomonas caeni TaxID=2984949 RepID=UPI002230FC2C|nr:stage II sporulation protein M [Sphingomonas caeni]MCW3848202.1 stage II sporulation protein M [Sphingomonas caeni]